VSRSLASRKPKPHADRQCRSDPDREGGSSAEPEATVAEPSTRASRGIAARADSWDGSVWMLRVVRVATIESWLPS
jgi:hypothetical protein